MISKFFSIVHLDMLSRNYRRRDLPDLVASVPPSADIPRSDAIDIPGNGGRRRQGVPANSAPASPESIGQELRRIADDFDLSFGTTSGRNRTSSYCTVRTSRRLSFIQRSRSLSLVSSFL